MLEEIRNIKSDKGALRQFGITMGIVLAALGALFLLRDKNFFPYFFVAASLLLFLGATAPVILKPLQKFWLGLALIIGWLLTRLILTFLFYLVLSPLAIAAKLLGKHFLDTGFDRGADSYWLSRKAVSFDRKSYENQF